MPLWDDAIASFTGQPQISNDGSLLSHLYRLLGLQSDPEAQGQAQASQQMAPAIGDGLAGLGTQPVASPPPPLILTANAELEELQRRSAEARQTNEVGDTRAGAIERRELAPGQVTGDPVLNRTTGIPGIDPYMARGSTSPASGDPVLRRPQPRPPDLKREYKPLRERRT